MTVPDDRPSLAEDIAALDRIIERLQGFGEDVLLRVLSILQQHERVTADLAAANERIRQLDAENQGFMREVAILNERIARLEAGLRDCQGALKEARYWVVKSGVSHPSSLAAIVDPAIEAAEEMLTP
jgi:chromosome segregation ATPase